MNGFNSDLNAFSRSGNVLGRYGRLLVSVDDLPARIAAGESVRYTVTVHNADSLPLRSPYLIESRFTDTGSPFETRPLGPSVLLPGSEFRIDREATFKPGPLVLLTTAVAVGPDGSSFCVAKGVVRRIVLAEPSQTSGGHDPQRAPDAPRRNCETGENDLMNQRRDDPHESDLYMDELYRRLERVSRSMMSRRQDREDILHDAWLKLRSLREKDPDRTFNNSFLKTAARWELLNAIGGETPFAEDVFKDEDDIPIPIDELLKMNVDHPRRMEIEDCLSRMNPEHRRVLFLRRFVGFNARQIATLLETTLARVQTRSTRARNALLDCLRTRGILQ